MANKAAQAIVLMVLASISLAAHNGCKSPQYLEIGKTGTIVCSFSDSFSSIHWYYKQTITEGPATVSYINDQNVEGAGYDSGEFDIRSDGSLIINNVSVEHEIKFTVYEYETDQESLSRHDIDLITYIRPNPPFPVVDDCDIQSSVCYIQWKQGRSLNCGMQEARPAMPLTWLANTVEGDIQLNNITIFKNKTSTWTSFMTVTEPMMHSSYLSLLVCKAADPLNLLVQSEELVLVHNKGKETSQVDTTEVAVARNENIELPCIDGHYMLLVWELISTEDNVSTPVVVDVDTANATYVISREYELREGNLIISDVQLRHEGIYMCTYTYGTMEGVILLNLVVYENPIPNYPIIDGCTQDRYCVLDVNYNEILRCAVKGIRPEVDLEWRAYYDDSATMISFHGQQQLKTESIDGTFDIILTTEFTVKDTSNNRLTVECRAVGTNAKLFKLTSKAELLFQGLEPQITNKIVNTDGSPPPTINNQYTFVFIIISVVAVAILVGAGCIYLGYRKTRDPQVSTANIEENVPMVQKTESDALKTFIAQLKLNYENLYCGIKPIPFLQDRCTVHELYVEGGIEYLLKGQTMKQKWERFDSYKNLFTHPQLSGNRWIIEAEPGYGKSTLALQLAYEWCHEVPGSSLCSIDIFLLIRLRQLKDVSSIYEAIKRFILPTNSQFTIDEIKSFIDKCPSLMIILDGFDEYPERKVENSDIFNILQRKMFPGCKVLLTTRSSRLPKEYAAQTNRLRLTGFKSEAQEEYLQKVVAINGYKSFENTIKEWLEENPVLKELCVVPLFFVMYAHLSLQSDALKNCTSMTSFFRYMITCLHSHMKSKFKDENVEKFKINENNHQQLDELCFAKLNGHSYNPDMDKEDLVQKLGKDFLDQYLTIGILREEETIVVSNQPGIEASEHVKIVSKIRFYHSLFCEWYAAHHLANVLDKVNEILDDELREDELEILEDLDPIELQYVVRFACGIKPTAAKYILEHLKISQEGIEALPILCILEQVGNVDKIMESLRDVCSGSLQIRDQDNNIIQRSVIKILELAASRKITIPKVILIESFKRVDTENNEIVLNSEVFVPKLCDVSQLSFEHKEMEFSHDILEDIFKFISHCRNLKEIRFLYSLLPYKVDAEPVLRQLSAKNVKVCWFPSSIRFDLDLNSGYWVKNIGSSRMTEQEYKKMVAAFRVFEE